MWNTSVTSDPNYGFTDSIMAFMFLARSSIYAMAMRMMH
jgi:hypothetical protein